MLAPERSIVPISISDLSRFMDIAHLDREDLFLRNRKVAKLYADRVLCVTLCQGAALHYVDGKKISLKNGSPPDKAEKSKRVHRESSNIMRR